MFNVSQQHEDKRMTDLQLAFLRLGLQWGIAALCTLSYLTSPVVLSLTGSARATHCHRPFVMHGVAQPSFSQIPQI